MQLLLSDILKLFISLSPSMKLVKLMMLNFSMLGCPCKHLASVIATGHVVWLTAVSSLAQIYIKSWKTRTRSAIVIS